MGGGALAGHELWFYYAEGSSSIAQGLGVGSAQGQCSQYWDRQMHTCHDLPWPLYQLCSQVAQLRDHLLQEAFPVPFALLLNDHVKAKVFLDPHSAHPHSDSCCDSSLGFIHLPNPLLAIRSRRQSHLGPQHSFWPQQVFSV